MASNQPRHVQLGTSPKEEEDKFAILGPSKYTRHSRYYLVDGNIAVICQSTVFKVYDGLLSAHSEVLRGMLSVKGEAGQVYEGHAALRLDDSAEDFAYFLDALLELK